MNGIADNYDVNRKYDMYFLEAMTMRQKGKHTEAFNLLQHCRQLRPEASEAYYFLAQYLTEMKQQADLLQSTVFVLLRKNPEPM